MNTTILSFTKPFTTFPARFPQRAAQLHHRQSLVLCPTKSSVDSSNNTTTSKEGADDASPPLPPSGTQPDSVQIRFKRGSRRRARQQQESGGANGLPKQPKAAAPKDWESMTLTEKAIELYVGEKGLLFWINKFAYASIFIIIGAWILFRFVGPALNLYQLDAPPLSPSAVLKGS